VLPYLVCFPRFVSQQFGLASRMGLCHLEQSLLLFLLLATLQASFSIRGDLRVKVLSLGVGILFLSAK
jgi:hypothetical protein